MAAKKRDTKPNDATMQQGVSGVAGGSAFSGNLSTNVAGTTAVMEPPAADPTDAEPIAGDNLVRREARFGPYLTVCHPGTISAEDGSELVARWSLPGGQRQVEIRKLAIDRWEVWDTDDRDGRPTRHQNVRAAWIQAHDAFRQAALAWWMSRAP